MFMRILVAAFAICVSGPAWAGIVVIPVPEPTSLALLAAGVAGAAVVRAVRKRRK